MSNGCRVRVTVDDPNISVLEATPEDVASWRREDAARERRKRIADRLGVPLIRRWLHRHIGHVKLSRPCYDCGIGAVVPARECVLCLQYESRRPGEDWRVVRAGWRDLPKRDE